MRGWEVGVGAERTSRSMLDMLNLRVPVGLGGEDTQVVLVSEMGLGWRCGFEITRYMMGGEAVPVDEMARGENKRESPGAAGASGVSWGRGPSQWG